jgi:hypothetical protein
VVRGRLLPFAPRPFSWHDEVVRVARVAKVRHNALDCLLCTPLSGTPRDVRQAAALGVAAS